MPTTIRRAEITDAAAIAHVQVETWKSTYSGIVPDAFLASMDATARTANWNEQLAENVLTFVAEDGSGVIGFACGGSLRERVGDYDGELYAIYLMPQKQKLGAGTALTQTLARALHAQGLKSLLVWVLEQNPVVQFYKHLGAVQVTQKQIEIGGVTLPEIALGWPAIDCLLD